MTSSWGLKFKLLRTKAGRPVDKSRQKAKKNMVQDRILHVSYCVRKDKLRANDRYEECT